MSKFIIQYDSSRYNTNNEPLPLAQFVPGVISMKNTLKPYNLIIGNLNKSSFDSAIDVFKSNIEIYKKILASLPTSTQIQPDNTVILYPPDGLPSVVNNNRNPTPLRGNNAYGSITPYVFNDTKPNLVPHVNNANYLDTLRKKAMESLNINTNIFSRDKVPPLPPRFSSDIKLK